MKVIDLLNKIANNEEVPNQFVASGHSYTMIKYPACGKEIINYQDEDNDYLFGAEYELGLILNTEIEIIEEKPKKIEEMECNVESWFTPTQADIEIIKKVNEIKDVVNYLLEKESDK